jgi:hypothetical protein
VFSAGEGGRAGSLVAGREVGVATVVVERRSDAGGGEGLHERSIPITDRQSSKRETLLIFIPYSRFLTDYAWVNSIYLFFVFITIGKKISQVSDKTWL